MPAVIDEIRKLIEVRDDYVVTGHLTPDADSVGACFGLALALEKMNKKVKVVLEPYAQKYDIIPGRHLQYRGALPELNAKVLFCLDCGDTARLGAARDLIDQCEDTICVDHHATNTGYARYNYIDADASSTCELIFRLIEPLVSLDLEIASALYAGIVHDTGGFRYNATSPLTMEIVGRLMTQGIPFTSICTAMLHQHSFKEAKLFGKVLDACTLYAGGRVAYSCVTCDMMAEVGASAKDLDGVVEYLVSIRGVEAAVLLYQKSETEVKASFRSHNINVGSIAHQLGGGGHRLAAGCSLQGDIHSAAERVLTMMEWELEHE